MENKLNNDGRSITSMYTLEMKPKLKAPIRKDTFIREKTLTNCSFNMADISMSNLAASNWLTLDIEIGIIDCHINENIRKRVTQCKGHLSTH